MSKELWRLTVRDEFSAGHALRHYEGKCERPHGHNFAVDMVVEGYTLTPDTALLLDFKILKTLLHDVLHEMDHNMLNDVPPFDVINPSSENLARHVWRHAAAKLAAHDDAQAKCVRLVSVTVSEKSSQSATYMEI